MSIIAEKLPSQHEFAGVVDSAFRVRSESGEDLDLILTEVHGFVSNDVQENFSLLFRATGDADPPQNIYRLEHDKLGTMDLFLVPLKRDESGVYLEAVFNLIKAAGV